MDTVELVQELRKRGLGDERALSGVGEEGRVGDVEGEVEEGRRTMRLIRTLHA